MKNVLELFIKHKIITAFLSIGIGASLGICLEVASLTNIRGLLGWAFFLGIFIVLWLHAKSFFSTDNLGIFYSRMYGFGFGLIYASAVFYLFTFYAGQQNHFFNKIGLSTILSICIYNFLSNNYAGIEKQHLIAKHMIEKEQKKIDKNLEK